MTNLVVVNDLVVVTNLVVVVYSLVVLEHMPRTLKSNAQLITLLLNKWLKHVVLVEACDWKTQSITCVRW